MWTLEYSRDALKSLVRMPRDQSHRIRLKLNRLVRNPRDAPGVKKLSGQPGYRLRVGDWRVVYFLDEQRIVVVVVRIAARGEAYK